MKLYVVSLLWRQAGQVGEFVVEAPADGFTRLSNDDQRAHGARARETELDFLARLGDEGWEMISVDAYVKWFKRSIP